MTVYMTDNGPVLALIFLHLLILHHSPGLVKSSPPRLAAASVRPALPWRADAPPPAGSRHTDSPSSGRSVCGLSSTKRRRGSDSGRIWGSGSSCVASADVPLETGTLDFLLCPRGRCTAQRIRQDSSRQQLPQLPLILKRKVLLRSPAAGLLPTERTFRIKRARILLLFRYAASFEQPERGFYLLVQMVPPDCCRHLLYYNCSLYVISISVKIF